MSQRNRHLPWFGKRRIGPPPEAYVYSIWGAPAAEAYVPRLIVTTKDSTNGKP